MTHAQPRSFEVNSKNLIFFFLGNGWTWRLDNWSRDWGRSWCPNFGFGYRNRSRIECFWKTCFCLEIIKYKYKKFLILGWKGLFSPFRLFVQSASSILNIASNVQVNFWFSFTFFEKFDWAPNFRKKLKFQNQANEASEQNLDIRTLRSENFDFWKFWKCIFFIYLLMLSCAYWQSDLLWSCLT